MYVVPLPTEGSLLAVGAVEVEHAVLEHAVEPRPAAPLEAESAEEAAAVGGADVGGRAGGVQSGRRLPAAALLTAQIQCQPITELQETH